MASTIRKTRYAALGFRSDGPALWRFVCIETGSSVGPQYASKAELLADLERYATANGWS